jgi:antitoxin (DNA-binding transcriptional repressor) of toxin-antitoxin stability system
MRGPIMTSISIQDAQANLGAVIDQLSVGEELIVTRNEEPVAKLARLAPASWPCKAGSAKDKILWIAPDFDAPLEEFREYME